MSEPQVGRQVSAEPMPGFQLRVAFVQGHLYQGIPESYERLLTSFSSQFGISRSLRPVA
jgi:hypothetical protein